MYNRESLAFCVQTNKQNQFSKLKNARNALAHVCVSLLSKLYQLIKHQPKLKSELEMESMRANGEYRQQTIQNYADSLETKLNGQPFQV